MSNVGYVYLPSSCERRGIEAYSAWASALLVQLPRAMQEPQAVGRVTSTDSHASFYAHDKPLTKPCHYRGPVAKWTLEQNYAQIYHYHQADVQ